MVYIRADVSSPNYRGDHCIQRQQRHKCCSSKSAPVPSMWSDTDPFLFQFLVSVLLTRLILWIFWKYWYFVDPSAHPYWLDKWDIICKVDMSTGRWCKTKPGGGFTLDRVQEHASCLCLPVRVGSFWCASEGDGGSCRNVLLWTYCKHRTESAEWHFDLENSFLISHPEQTSKVRGSDVQKISTHFSHLRRLREKRVMQNMIALYSFAHCSVSVLQVWLWCPSDSSQLRRDGVKPTNPWEANGSGDQSLCPGDGLWGGICHWWEQSSPVP